MWARKASTCNAKKRRLPEVPRADARRPTAFLMLLKSLRQHVPTGNSYSHSSPNEQLLREAQGPAAITRKEQIGTCVLSVAGLMDSFSSCSAEGALRKSRLQRWLAAWKPCPHRCTPHSPRLSALGSSWPAASARTCTKASRRLLWHAR